MRALRASSSPQARSGAPGVENARGGRRRGQLSRGRGRGRRPGAGGLAWAAEEGPGDGAAAPAPAPGSFSLCASRDLWSPQKIGEGREAAPAGGTRWRHQNEREGRPERGCGTGPGYVRTRGRRPRGGRRGQALLRQRHHRLHRREPPRSRPPAGELRPRPARSRRRPSGPLLRPRDAAAPAADPPGWASAQAWPPGARLFLRRPAWQHRPGGSSAANLGPAGTGGGRGRLPRRPVLRAPRDVGRGRQAPPRRRVRHFRRAGIRVIAARGGEGSGRRRPRAAPGPMGVAEEEPGDGG